MIKFKLSIKDEVQLVMTITKFAFLILGWASLFLGALGVILPLLPTTPFVLLAAFAFSKSSERFHQWLLNHKLFGPLILDWQQNGVIKPQVKRLATFSIIIMLGLSFYLLPVPKPVVLGICFTVSLVLIFIWTRPSYPRER